MVHSVALQLSIVSEGAWKRCNRKIPPFSEIFSYTTAVVRGFVFGYHIVISGNLYHLVQTIHTTICQLDSPMYNVQKKNVLNVKWRWSMAEYECTISISILIDTADSISWN